MLLHTSYKWTEHDKEQALVRVAVSLEGISTGIILLHQTVQ